MEFYKHYSDYPLSDWRWKSFSPREMASKREGELAIVPYAMDMLQSLRNRLGVPLIITSAYRSKAHNTAVGGAKNSYHMRAEAFDIRMDNHDPVEFEKAARSVGFTGFGYYPKQGFMHIDVGPSRSWGKKFPVTATRLPAEPERAPEHLRDDPVARAGGAVAGVGAGVGVIEVVDRVGMLGSLSPVAQAIGIAALVIIGGYLIWRQR